MVEARVPRGTFEALSTYVAMLEQEASRQNLVSQATLLAVWQRHILDSLQLLDMADRHGTWADLGSGAGLPGLVIAIASDLPVILIEPRRRRAEFLQQVVDQLALATRVTVIARRSEVVRIDEPAIVSARAVAPLEQLFAMAAPFATRATQWILPKGRTAADEVAIARQTWQGRFELVPSVTEPGSIIVVARDIHRRGHP